ncbi:MAG: hypothetical protein LBV13_04335 [Methanomassiliicoccaceae archaeon]|nr:hypothetical protein [Methanomassiliicoccaceae archaeon]
MARSKGSSPIDAKKMPMPIFIGLVLLIIGILIVMWGVISIVSDALNDVSASGLMGGILIVLLGSLIAAIGGALMIGGLMGKLFGGRYKRIVY